MTYDFSLDDFENTVTVFSDITDNAGCASKCIELGNSCWGYLLQRFSVGPVRCGIFNKDDPRDINMVTNPLIDTYMRCSSQSNFGSGNTQFFSI